jgi:hypothetical protein
MAIAEHLLLAENTLAAGDVERHEHVVARLELLDLEPTCSTMPVNSWPNVIPMRVSGTEPLYKWRSDPQMHDRVTRTIASCGCRISGIGFSSMRTRKGPR